MIDSRSLSRLRVAALPVLLLGAAGSLSFMLLAGRRNPSRMLLMLMALWVSSPFAALLWANLASKNWLTTTRSALYAVMLIVPLASLFAYALDAVKPHKSQAAAVFVIVPPAAWLFTVIVLSVTGWRSRAVVSRSSAATKKPD